MRKPVFAYAKTKTSDFFHLFGNGTHTGSIGKNSIVFPPTGKKIAPLDLFQI